MSLLGRLEDLSLADIVQIVFLSRRTGVLEIVDGAGRHTVLFRHGMVVNASGPDHPDLITFLMKHGDLPLNQMGAVRQIAEQGIPSGTAVIDMNLMSGEGLVEAVLARILTVVAPLLESREGEFNFILTDSISSADVEYEVDSLINERGFPPQKIIGLADGEKIKPLRELQESLKAGQALRRGTPQSSAEVLPPVDGGRTAPAAAIPTPSGHHSSAALPSSGPPGPARFKVSGGLFEIESPEAAYRNVVLHESDPLLRVAAKRAFGKRGVKIAQFGSLDDVRAAMTGLFRSNSFFVTFLERSSDEATLRVMQQLKRRNPRLPVVVIDSQADMRRRHDLLQAGADLYMTRPAPERMQPETAEQELALFADELVLFAERCFDSWEQLAGDFGAEAGKRFYELGEKEDVERSFVLLRQLINELNDPNDIDQVATTILRLSGEYLDRSALFIVSGESFVGLGGFGRSGDGTLMDERARQLRIEMNQPSLLKDVVSSGHPHRGRVRKTEANLRLIEGLGSPLPTEVVVLPIMHNERCIGILYGDNAEHRAPIDSMTGLEIFLSQAGYALGSAISAWRRAGGRGGERT